MINKVVCPCCNSNAKNINDWISGFSKSENGLYYFKCVECKVKLGSTLSYKGDLCIWDKKTEIK